MHDLLNWWFAWGAIVFLVTTIFIAALVIFDAMQRRAQAVGWLLGVILPPVLILPSVIFKTQLDTASPNNGTTIEGTAELSFWLGALAGLVAVIDAIGYFMTVAAQPVRQPEQRDRVYVQPPNQGNMGGYPGGFPGGGRPQGGGGGGGAAQTIGGGGVAAPPRATANGRLFVRNGHGAPREYRLYKGRTSLGRENDNDIIIDDMDVSRDHGHIQEQNGHFVIVDHGSTHGTYVNGERVRGQAQLMDNDEIMLGPSVRATFKSF